MTVFDESVFTGTVDCMIVRKGQHKTEKRLIFRLKDGTEVPIIIYLMQITRRQSRRRAIRRKLGLRAFYIFR